MFRSGKKGVEFDSKSVQIDVKMARVEWWTDLETSK